MVSSPVHGSVNRKRLGKNTQEDEGGRDGPLFFCPYADFGCRVARRPRLRGAGAGAISSGAGASSRGAGAGSSNKGATRSDRGELIADRGELIADRGELAAD